MTSRPHRRAAPGDLLEHLDAAPTALDIRGPGLSRLRRRWQRAEQRPLRGRR